MYSKNEYKVEHAFGHWNESIEDQNNRAAVIDFLESEIEDCRERDIRTDKMNSAIEYIHIYNKTLANSLKRGLDIEHPSQRYYELKSIIGLIKDL
tara:strand:+ start:1205 stop:1489 length:285 start_codon:yes stop_codon:yes gene_type:complete